MVVAGMFAALCLLQVRKQIASIMSRLDIGVESPKSGSSAEKLQVIDVRCDDEGFTGGITGVFQPRAQLFPARWREVLESEGARLAIARRSLAVKSGSWMRGRVVALSFTVVGLIFASLLVPTVDLGTASGTIQFSLWFSLWSFLGLLTLPTLSRRGVIEIDERVQSEGYPVSLMRTVTERLDRLQDGEPARPTLVETIFHPVPSVENRLEGPRSHQVTGYWDAARTSIYISAAGVGLLGRAVHCNCGRPSLWVFLPTD
jgi:hypothetical protein